VKTKGSARTVTKVLVYVFGASALAMVTTMILTVVVGLIIVLASQCGGSGSPNGCRDQLPLFFGVGLILSPIINFGAFAGLAWAGQRSEWSVAFSDRVNTRLIRIFTTLAAVTTAAIVVVLVMIWW